MPTIASNQDSPMGFGERAVGLNFNPGNDPKVQEIKELYAKIINICYEGSVPATPDSVMNHEQVRLFKIAITEAQGAQMWAVKAITWK